MNQISLPKYSKMLNPKFCFGVATAAFQIEGGSQHRLPCIWDTFCSKEDTIEDQSNGDVACDHYHLWERDIQLIQSLGVDAYRFSISWGRVLHQDGSLNPQGIEFYLGILKQLKQYNIKAYVTLYHWDLPQHIEDQGGWLNRNTAYLFAEYVEKVAIAFAGLVYSYATLNEPFCSSYLGYGTGEHAPGFKNKNYVKKSAHHLLLAHGLAMQVLNKVSPDTQNGIVLNFTPAYSKSNDQADIKAANLAEQHYNQWYARPILAGKYPDLINDLPSAQQPDIQAGDMDIIHSPLDYLGVNYYTREIYGFDQHQEFIECPCQQAARTDMDWEIYPKGLTDLLISLNETYQLPPLFITENGAAMKDKIVADKVDDKQRIDYLHHHINAVDKAIESGVDIRGYFAWSLMDNFEWAFGYQKRFGIVYVDYATQERIIKASGYAYQHLLNHRQHRLNKQ